MPFAISLSFLNARKVTPEEFKEKVMYHIAQMHAFTRTVGKPRPSVHPMIESCCKRVVVKGQPDEYVPDYEIVDDTPKDTPMSVTELTLEDRKQVLHMEIQRAEAEAKTRVLAQRKLRLQTLKFNIAMEKPEVERTQTDNEAIADTLDYSKRFRAIELLAAQAEHDLEDLTAANIDSWKVPTFP